jgi:hypothetical protein
MGRDEYTTKKQAFVSVEDEGFAIELFEPKQNKEEKLMSKPDHLAFEVEDLTGFRDQLIKRRPEMETPAIERYDNGVQCLGLKDPDGMPIEFFHGRKIYDAFLAEQPEGGRGGAH